MNFSDWLDIDEARFRGPVGGAFGRDSRRMQQVKKPKPKPEPEMAVATATTPGNRMDNRFQTIDKRVEYGKTIEKQVFDSLVACGMDLRPPTNRQDMYDKIDGWWVQPSGAVPIQIKYRDTGDDILFEVMKDYDRDIPGRDMIGKAKVYAVLKRDHSILVVSVDDAKLLINQAVAEAERGGFDDRGNYRNSNVTLRIRPDPRDGQNKLMAYVSPQALKQVFPVCRGNVAF